MLQAFYRFIELDLSYSSFEGLGASHPSWEERLTFIDEDKQVLWRSMMSFKTGVSLLAAEQYPMAANLFREVVSRFPESYEAHANLGYAQLMDYLDQLEPSDIAQFGIGHVVVGAFTRRPESMEPAVRGVNAALWFQARTALETALRLNPNMAEAKANLGIAMLVQPQGKDEARAKQLLTEAVALAQADYSMDKRAKAAIYINAGVAELAVGLLKESFDYMASAEVEINQVAGFVGSSDRIVRGELEASLYYNTALIFSNTSDAELLTASADYYNAYLSGTSPTSNWWNIAYNRYVQVCGQIGRTPRSIEDYRQNHVESYRTLTSFTFPNNVQVNLGQPLEEFLGNMSMRGGDVANFERYLIIEDTGLIDYAFFNIATSVWATQEVLSIQLYGTNAPALSIKETGLGSDEKKIYVGMSEAELNSHLGTDFERRLLVTWSDDYRFYRDLGLAAAVENGVVTQLVITQVPYAHYWEPADE